MSRRSPSIVRPGRGRLTLALLAIVPAALAYPWSTVTHRWLLGVAVAFTIVVLAWWNGRHLTTAVARRVSVFLRRNRPVTERQSGRPATDERVTAVLRIQSGPTPELPLELIAGYLDRYGVRSESVRVSTRSTRDERTTWVGLTLAAAPNLAALQARSAELPLRETAEAALRRLADELRQLGWSVNTVDAGIPDLLTDGAKEQWRTVVSGDGGYLTAYNIAVDDALPQTLAAIEEQSALEAWTALEIVRTRAGYQVAAGYALRTEQAGEVDIAGLLPQRGYQLKALDALHPLSPEKLVAPYVPLNRWPQLRWTAVVDAQIAA